MGGLVVSDPVSVRMLPAFLCPMQKTLHKIGAGKGEEQQQRAGDQQLASVQAIAPHQCHQCRKYQPSAHYRGYSHLAFLSPKLNPTIARFSGSEKSLSVGGSGLRALLQYMLSGARLQPQDIDDASQGNHRHHQKCDMEGCQ